MEIQTYSDVMVFIEQREGLVQKVSLELVSKGREIADELGAQLKAVVLSSSLEADPKDLISLGCDEVILVSHPLLEPYTTEPYAKALTEVISVHKPEIVLFGATTIGRDLAPRVSSRLDTGLTADCTKLEVDMENRNLLMTRPAFGGNIMATIVCPNHRPQMSTVRPGVMQMAEIDPSRTGKLVEFEVSLTDEDRNVEVLEVVKASKKKVNIEDASILVSGGRGIGSPDSFPVLETLADRLGGSVSASRAAIDAGWIDRSHQVGQTGKTVRPDLYFACGISGAIQHLAGMEESEFIVAINKDETAPIFEAADLSIVGDVHKIIPELIRLLPDNKKLNA